MTASQIAVLRWAFGITPYLVRYVAVVIGSDEWIYGPGWLTRIVLVVLAARAIRAEERASASQTSA